MNASQIVQQFAAMYQTLHKDNLHLLQSVYSDDVVFIDALHEVNGLPALERYFAAMYGNLISSSIDINDIQSSSQSNHNGEIEEGAAYLSWVMKYSHPHIAGGKMITLDGVTFIRFTDKIHYHRDYVDMGQMLYEHIPVLGSVIRMIKRRAVS